MHTGLSRTRRLVILALMISLNVILARFASVRIAIGGVEGIRIGLGNFPVIFAGLFLGPVAGGITGALGDIMGFMLNPMGVYMPHFTLTAFLTGAVPGMVFHLLGGPERKGYFRFLISISSGLIISSVILVPYFLNSLFGIPWWSIMPARLVSFCIVAPFYSFFAEKLSNKVPLPDVSAG